MRKFRFSLTGVMLAFLAILVIPLNFVSIAVASIMITDARDSIQNSIRMTISNYTETIDEVVVNTRNLMYDFSKYDPEYNAFFTMQDSLDYQLARQALSNTFIEKRQYINLADYCFFYHDDPDDYLLTPHNTQIFDNYFLNMATFLKKTAPNICTGISQSLMAGRI